MTARNVVLAVIPYLLIFLGLLMAMGMINQNKGVNAENNFYIRFQSCILSVKPAARSDTTIKNCYDTVQKETGVKVRRYDIGGY